MNSSMHIDGNALSSNSVIKCAEGLKMMRREGNMLVISPSCGGSLLLDEVGQALYKSLNRPQEVQALLDGTEEKKSQDILAAMFREGIVQILGKDGSCDWKREQRPVQVRLELPRPESNPVDIPEEVAKSLAIWVAPEEQAHSALSDWSEFLVQLPSTALTLETTLLTPAMVAELERLLAGIPAERALNRLVIHTHLDEAMVKALTHLLKEGAGRDFTAEVLCYCPAGDLDSYKQRIGRLLTQHIACLPVGCIQSPEQLRTWKNLVVAWRYRSFGVSMRTLLQGESWEKQDLLEGLCAAWMELVEDIGKYGEQNQVRLRVHPLERWLVVLGCRNLLEPPQRFEAAFLEDGKISWSEISELPAICGRCFARGYCAYLERSQMCSARCWLRKKVFEELLWRLHSRCDLVNFFFNKCNAL